MPTPTHLRPTSWWLQTLERRKARMAHDHVDLSTPIAWSSEAERLAAIRFFNAAYRAEESGLQQAHELAAAFDKTDPDLAATLRLYGDEEGWHRELLVKFIAFLGGEIRPMGRITGTFYKLYGAAKRMESIVLTNLMFETIGSTTYRLALARCRHAPVRQLLTILARDESFHVPLNTHFLREVLRERPVAARLRLVPLYHSLYFALIASAYASRRVARAFDHLSFPELARAYAAELGRVFAHEPDIGLQPFWPALRMFGIRRAELLEPAVVDKAC